MNVAAFLADTSAQLSAAGIGSARLDCLILLEDATGRDRAWLLAHPEFELPEMLLNRLEPQVRRRLEHVPLAYIRGKTEFYGRVFVVNEHVLEPRPESETMLDMLKGLPLLPATAIVDVGTGSGALAVSAKLELPGSIVIATDIDQACLAVAGVNAKQLGATIDLRQTDLLHGIAAANVIVANLPYVPDNFTINQAASNEPRLAIFGGPDGLDVYRRMFEHISAMDTPPDYVLCESLPPQHQEMCRIARQAGYRQADEQDFIQNFTR